MKFRNILAAALAAVMLGSLLALSGCSDKTDKTDKDDKAAAKPVILVVSFGTSYNDSRDAALSPARSSLTSSRRETVWKSTTSRKRSTDLLRTA